MDANSQHRRYAPTGLDRLVDTARTYTVPADRYWSDGETVIRFDRHGPAVVGNLPVTRRARSEAIAASTTPNLI